MNNGLDLGGAYEATLGRIKAQDGDKGRLGMAVLMWISHSRRPLQVDEICHAIAIQIGSNDLNSDDIPAISTLLGCCQGLVTVDKGTSNVRLIHFTLQEHLCTHPGIFDRAHSTIAETCLTYLNLRRIKDLSADTFHDPRGTPILEYSSIYWGAHMRMEVSDLAKTLALELLDQFDSHISAVFLWESISMRLLIAYGPSHMTSSTLHCVSYFGIADVANTLIKMNRWDVNQRDGMGITPLIWAAIHGHEEVVRLLLRNKNIQLDQRDTNSGRTALSWAAGYGHEGVVRLFLGLQFANPRSIGHLWGKVPQVASLLFGRRYVNPNSSSISGQTPLSWAAGNGHEGTVKLLLGQEDVNPNSSIKSGRTLLSWAAEGSHEGIVKLLLERKDLNPNISDTCDGQTPLSWAAGNGHEGVVKLLLGRKDVDPNSLNKSGRTLLSWAAEEGHEGVVKLLLGRKDVNPNSLNKSGRTPLSSAAEDGHEGIVKLLLGCEGVNPDIPDTFFGQTPLSCAARSGHEGIVKLLLGRKDVNPDSSSGSGRTPLSWAARYGHEGIVKLLLERKDVNPNSYDNLDWTPLGLAAGGGHHRVVELLRARHSQHIQ